MHDLESVKTVVGRILGVATIIVYLTPNKVDDQVLAFLKTLTQSDEIMKVLVDLLNSLSDKDKQNPQVVAAKFMELVK